MLDDFFKAADIVSEAGFQTTSFWLQSSSTLLHWYFRNVNLVSQLRWLGVGFGVQSSQEWVVRPQADQFQQLHCWVTAPQARACLWNRKKKNKQSLHLSWLFSYSALLFVSVIFFECCIHTQRRYRVLISQRKFHL